MRPVLPFSLVSKVLAALLLAAAGLKLHGLAFAPVAAMGFFSSPEFQVGLVEFEVFLGVWLFSGKRPIGSWLTALLAFAGFAAFSAYQGWIGQASCGCFGALRVSPWAAFGFDVLMVNTLLLAQPDLQPVWENPRDSLLTATAPLAGGLLAVAALLALLAHLTFGSTPAALAYLRGERISVHPRLLDMGQGEPGETREGTLELQNWTDQPVRLIGGTADCSCAVTGDLPVNIPPGEARSITVTMRLPSARGMFTRKAFLFTDDDEARTLVFRLTGRINPGVEKIKTAGTGNGG